VQGLQLLQALDGRTRAVKSGARADALGQAVLHARQLEHRSHRATGNATAACDEVAEVTQ